MSARAALVFSLATALALAPLFARASAPDGTPATYPPHAAAKLQGWAQTLRAAADGFRAGQQQKVAVDKAWFQRVYDVAKESCTMHEELLAWHDGQPRAAFAAIYQCLLRSEGAWSACDLKTNLALSMGCGGANGPAYCYEGFANDAMRSAAALEAWAGCVNLGIPAQAQADADAAARKQAADAAAQDSASPTTQQANKPQADKPQADKQRDAQQREDDKRERDAQVRAAYDAKAAEIERRNQVAGRWDRGVALRDQQLADQNQARADLVSSIDGGGNAPSGASWRVHAFLGAGGIVFPIYTDATGADIQSYSSVGYAGGMGMEGSLELWPYFGPHAGIAAAIDGSLGWMPGVNGGGWGMEGYLALRGFAGRDGRAAVLAEVGHAWRMGATSTDIGAGIVDAWERGTASYELTRVGVGARYCIWSDPEDPRFCMGGLDAMVFWDLLPDQRPVVWRLNFWARGMVVVGADVGWTYPAAGTHQFATDDDDGRFVLVRIEKGWDWFGDPYGETAAAREKRLQRKKELEGL